MVKWALLIMTKCNFHINLSNLFSSQWCRWWMMIPNYMRQIMSTCVSYRGYREMRHEGWDSSSSNSSQYSVRSDTGKSWQTNAQLQMNKWNEGENVERWKLKDWGGDETKSFDTTNFVFLLIFTWCSYVHVPRTGNFETRWRSRESERDFAGGGPRRGWNNVIMQICGRAKKWKLKRKV